MSPTNNFVSLWDTPVIEKKEEPTKKTSSSWKKYVVTAGENRNHRQLFLCVFDDCDEWSISAVPCKMTKTRAYEAIAQAKKEMKKELKTQFFKRLTDEINFEIVLASDINIF